MSLWIIQVEQVLREVNLRCWTIVLALGTSGKADLITDCFVKDSSSVCLHVLNLSLSSESIYSFWKLLILVPWGQALRIYQLLGSFCFCPVRCDTFLPLIATSLNPLAWWRLDGGTSSWFWKVIWGLVPSAAFQVLQNLPMAGCTSSLLLAKRPFWGEAERKQGRQSLAVCPRWQGTHIVAEAERRWG